MDPSKNIIPENVREIHIIAVCGTAMGALACMLRESGYKVTGSDYQVYPPMSTFLEEKGIELIEGFSEENLSYGPDLVIIGNAVRKENPEAIAASEQGLFYCSMPQALNHFFVRDRQAIVVTGTHGKTTTSSILTWLLYSAGLDPSFMIGGILKNFDSNYRLGNGRYIVIEGDEYDTAFFDKGPKFNHFDPDITILTSIEFDHADIFRDLEHIISTFDGYIARHREESLVIACDSDSNIERVLDNRKLKTELYGFSEKADWRCTKWWVENGAVRFDIKGKDDSAAEFTSCVPGKHNVMNTLAVIAAAYKIGLSSEEIALGLKTFKGIRRRQDVRGIKNGIRIIDDFAHHPTAVMETIKAVRSFYTEGRLVAVFEPRTNSSRRNVFQSAYTFVFDEADIILVREPPGLDSIPEQERFSSARLVSELVDRGKEAFFFRTTVDIIEWLRKSALTGDTVLIMSNGGFDNIHEELLEVL